MSIGIILGLLGGLALFLYGMQMMSDGLEAAAGERLKLILEKLTSNRFMGVLVGAIITAIIQSSSATTVMVVGFVNAKMMTLRQAVWIIMGANIGTTITGQLIALDVGALAPLLAFIGVALIVFLKNPKLKYFGEILAGLGILFIGMDMMGSAMEPLREAQWFIDIVTKFSNPLIGILVGAGFTALIQSSSASVGILQALAISGVINLEGAVYVLFGQNIGTCITAVLAAIGTSREAKQTTVIHLSFNIIGTIIFTFVCMFTPLTSFVASFTPINAAAQIANMHTLFNIVTTCLLLPFGTKLADLAEKILPVTDTENQRGLKYIQPLSHAGNNFGGSLANIEQVKNEIIHMMDIAYSNVYLAINQLIEYHEDKHEEIMENEKEVDYLNGAIADYISEVLADAQLNMNTSSALSSYYLTLTDLERISDYAVSMEKQAKKFSNAIYNKELLVEMKETVKEMQDNLYDLDKAQTKNKEIHQQVKQWRKNQISALKDKQVSSEIGVMLSRLLTDYKRINDHALNIAEELSGNTI